MQITVGSFDSKDLHSLDLLYMIIALVFIILL